MINQNMYKNSFHMVKINIEPLHAYQDIYEDFLTLARSLTNAVNVRSHLHLKIHMQTHTEEVITNLLYAQKT